MHKRSWERWGALVSSLLLGAGLGCVLCLVPSPLRLLVLAGLTPLLLLGAWLGCGLGAGGLLLFKWIERRCPSPLVAGNPLPPERREEANLRTPRFIRLRHSLIFLRVCHAWRVVQPEPADLPLEEETRGIPCHRCGVPASRAALLRCEECCHLFHPACCRTLADGSEGSETLCHSCWNAQTACRRRHGFPATFRNASVRRPIVGGQGEHQHPEKGGH